MNERNFFIKKILALIGFLYGVLLTIFVSLFFLKKVQFLLNEILNISFVRIWFNFLLHLFLAIGFIVSSRALYKDIRWGERAFLFFISINLLKEVYLFIREIINVYMGNITMSSPIEFIFICIFSVVAFIFLRKNKNGSENDYGSI